MNKKLGQADKDYLRSKYRNKVWKLGYHLLAYEVRDDNFEYIMQGGENVNCDKQKATAGMACSGHGQNGRETSC